MLAIFKCGTVSLVLGVNYSVCLFFFSVIGLVWNKRNFLLMMLNIELMFFAVGLNFILPAVFLSNTLGQICSLTLVTAAATETAVGLGLLVTIYRLESAVSYETLTTLRG